MKSMTGYGCFLLQASAYQVNCEIKSVNSRYLDLSIHLPKGLLLLENQIASAIKQVLHRGRIEVFIEVIKSDSLSEVPELNLTALDNYTRIIDQMQKQLAKNLTSSFASLNDLSPVDLLNLEGVLKFESSTQKNLKTIPGVEEGILEATSKALSAMVSHREQEGNAINLELAKMLVNLEKELTSLNNFLPEVRSYLAETYKLRIENIALDLKNNVTMPTDERMLQEICVLVEKGDVTEELARLKIHFNEFSRLMTTAEPVGRKLDFLCQELHREINTVGSKIQMAKLTPCLLEMKQLIERLRQQVQNIE